MCTFLLYVGDLEKVANTIVVLHAAGLETVASKIVAGRESLFSFGDQPEVYPHARTCFRVSKAWPTDPHVKSQSWCCSSREWSGTMLGALKAAFVHLRMLKNTLVPCGLAASAKEVAHASQRLSPCIDPCALDVECIGRSWFAFDGCAIQVSCERSFTQAHNDLR